MRQLLVQQKVFLNTVITFNIKLILVTVTEFIVKNQRTDLLEDS